MKKIILFSLLFSCCISSNAQNIPSKLLKNIDVIKDEFDGSIKYKSKTGVYILFENGIYTLRWQILAVESTPINIEKIQVLVNDVVTNIEFSKDEYKIYTKIQKGVQNTFSGSKIATTFVDKEMYYEEVDVDVTEYVSMFESMISNKTAKIKYSGGRDVIGVLDKKRVSSIGDVIELYKYIENQ